jgi:glycogen debranching enzyme
LRKTTANPEIPFLVSDDAELNTAFRIALGDLVGNIAPHQSGLLDQPAPAVLAGLEYDRPWTRDTAINVWNGAGLLFPEVARATLLSVLTRGASGTDEQGELHIGGQYWDAIIWTTGAWAYYLYTGDRDLLSQALEATRHSLQRFERTEFDPHLNLFRGPACYGDGVAAYPARYANAGMSGILAWPAANAAQTAARGYGIPMHALSTNCLYYQGYRLAEEMAHVLGQSADPTWTRKAEALRDAINRHFWNEAGGYYNYLVDPWGGSDHQEGLGHAFALLFDIADPMKATAVLDNQHITAAGIPCVWPSYARYTDDAGTSFGRHSGTVWPHVQGLWATTALEKGRAERFDFEFHRLAEHACRDAQFAEIYHPHTGEIYGGLQEDAGKGIREWHSCHRQTWSATAFLRMVLMGLIGMRFHPNGVEFRPHLPPGCTFVHLGNLRYREMMLDIHIQGSLQDASAEDVSKKDGSTFTLNGEVQSTAYLAGSGAGSHRIEIQKGG